MQNIIDIKSDKSQKDHTFENAFERQIDIHGR